MTHYIALGSNKICKPVVLYHVGLKPLTLKSIMKHSKGVYLYSISTTLHTLDLFFPPLSLCPYGYHSLFGLKRQWANKYIHKLLKPSTTNSARTLTLDLWLINLTSNQLCHTGPKT